MSEISSHKHEENIEYHNYMMYNWTVTYLLYGGRGDANTEAATADGRNDFARRVTAENESAGGAVLLHGATQSMLRVLRQSVHFGDENDWNIQ